MTSSPNPEQEYFKVVSQTAVSWIHSADAKASGALTIQAVLLGLMTFNVIQVKYSAMYSILLIGYIVAALVSITSCLLTLYPRLNRTRILGMKEVDSQSKSATYFWDVQTNNYNEFLKKSQKLTEDDLIEDQKEQAYIVTKIAARKMKTYRVSIISMLISICLFAFANIVHTISNTLQDEPLMNDSTVYQNECYFEED